MNSLQGITEQKYLSGAVYNTSFPQLQPTGQFSCRQVTEVKVDSRLFGLDSKTYSEDAKFKFNRDFKEITDRESEDTAWTSLFHSKPIVNRAWRNPEIMKYLLEIYSQFVHSFCNEAEAINTTVRLSEFLLAIDKEVVSSEKINPFELLMKYPKCVNNKLLIKSCACCARNSMDSFCEKNVILFCGLLPLIIELENYVNFFEIKYDFLDQFLADFLLSMISGGGRDFFLNKKTVSNYLKTFTEREELFEFFPIKHERLNLSPLFLMLNDYYWSKLYNPDIKTVDLSKKNDLRSFFYNSAAPQYLFDIVFGGFLACDQSYYDELACKAQSSIPKTSLLRRAEFNPELVRFGEEYEFSFESTSNERYSIDLLITKWSEYISYKISSMNIPESEFSITTKHGVQRKELYFTFGDWNCKFYNDYGLFEVNCSPYTIGQFFTCNGTTYTAYELFDLFINSPANQFLLKGISGHKHIDIRNSISNNPELLLRFLLSVENESYLTKALGRDSACKSHFPYLSMCDGASQWKTLIDRTVQLVNRELAAGKDTQPMEFYTYAYAFQHLWSLRHAYCPAKIRLCPQHASNHLEKRVCEPDGTLELRFWHCARTGQEARKINEIILAWMNTLSQKQKNKVPLFYESSDLENFDSNREVEMLFDNFCESIGLSPIEYRDLMRLT